MDEVLISGFLAATVRVSTPLLLAALGETLAERAGVINIGIEGAMLAGALGGAVGSAHGGLAFGLVLAVAAVDELTAAEATRFLSRSSGRSDNGPRARTTVGRGSRGEVPSCGRLDAVPGGSSDSTNETH